MIRDVDIQNKQIHIAYSYSDTLLYPASTLFPNDRLYPGEWKEITSNIVQGSIKLDEIIVDSEIKFGQIYSSSFEVQVYDIDDLSGKFLQVYQEDKSNGETKSIFCGRVISCKLDNTGLDRTIVAYDLSYIYREENVAEWWTKFWSERTDATVQECRESLLAYMGFSFETAILPNDDLIIHKNVDMTYIAFATVLSMLCEINTCFPHFNRSNELEFIVLDSESAGKDITDMYEGLNSSFEDFVTDPITGIEFYDSNNDLKYVYGEVTNTYKLSSNIFLFDLGTEELDIVGKAILDCISDIVFTPAQVKMIVGSLDLYLGDKVHTSKGDFYIFENQYSASQLVEQTISARGNQTLNQSSRSLTNSMIILDSKISKMTYDVEQFKIEFADYEEETNSKFEQTAEEIKLEVARGTEDMHATYEGSYTPTESNYPASEWTTNELKEKNVGATFYDSSNGITYRWTKKPNAVKITFSTDSATESTSYDYVEVYAYINGTYRKTAKYGGKGTSNGIAGKSIVIPNSQFYIYFISDNTVTDWGFKVASIESVYLNDYTTYFPYTSSLPSISATTITGTGTKPETDHPYANNSQKLWYWNTQISLSSVGYVWRQQEQYAYSRITQTADEIRSEVSARQAADTELSSSITQTASELTLSVSKKVSIGEVSSRLSMESDKITLSSGRLIISSGNFQLNSSGIATMNGAVININSSSGGSLTVRNSSGDTIFKVDSSSVTWNATNSSMNSSGTLTAAGATLNQANIVVNKNGGALTVRDSSDNIIFRVNSSGVMWNATNSSMTTSGALTINNATITGGNLTLGGSKNGTLYIQNSNDREIGEWTRNGIQIYSGGSPNRLRGEWNGSNLKLYDFYEDETVVLNTSGIKVYDDGDLVFKAGSSGTSMTGDLYTSDIHIYNNYIEYDRNTYIDMEGFDNGITLNADSAVFSVDDVHVTKYRSGSSVSTGDDGKFWSINSSGSSTYYEKTVLHGLITSGL